MLPRVHTMARFEQAKEQFKQQMCHNVDTLFNMFVSELNSHQQPTTSNNNILTTDSLQRILDTVALQKSSCDNQAVAQQQSLNATEFLTSTDRLEQVRSADDQQHHNVPLVPESERAHEANLNPATKQSDQNVIQTSDPLVENNLPQQPCQSTLFSIKQEITDEDEQLNEVQYYNDDTNWEESAQSDNISHVPGCHCESCQSGITNHEVAYNDSTNVQNYEAHNSFDNVPYNSAPCSYSMNDDEEIYDEELLREVKEEILEEQRINAIKQKNDQIDATQVGISMDQMTDDADQIINSISTSNQQLFPSPTPSTSSISSNSSVHSNYEEGEITNCQTEQNTESNALEDGELIDSDVDENISKFDNPKKQPNEKCHNNESKSATSFTTSVQEYPVPDIVSPSMSNQKIPSFDVLYDQVFRVISENCPSCNLPFGTQEELNGHMFQNHDLLPFACPFPACSISFLTRAELVEHFHHKNPNHSQINCRQCNRECTSPMSLFTHSSNHRQGKFACVKDKCRKISSYRGSAMKHYKQEHIHKDNQMLPNEVQMGTQEWVERSNILNHPGLSSPKRKRPMVDEQYEYNSDGRKALFSVISVNCTKKGCHFEFATENELASHLRVRHRIFDYLCPIEGCGMSFKLRSELINHSEVLHQDMLKFNCAKCDFSSADIMLLYKHNYIHHHEGNFLCGYEICAYMGKSHNDVINHYIYNHLYEHN